MNMRTTAIVSFCFFAMPVLMFAQTDEIQVYDGEIAPPGIFNLMIHNNFTPKGRTVPGYPVRVIASNLIRSLPSGRMVPRGWQAYSRNKLDGTRGGDRVGHPPVCFNGGDWDHQNEAAIDFEKAGNARGFLRGHSEAREWRWTRKLRARFLYRDMPRENGRCRRPLPDRFRC